MKKDTKMQGKKRNYIEEGVDKWLDDVVDVAKAYVENDMRHAVKEALSYGGSESGVIEGDFGYVEIEYLDLTTKENIESFLNHVRGDVETKISENASVPFSHIARLVLPKEKPTNDEEISKLEETLDKVKEEWSSYINKKFNEITGSEKWRKTCESVSLIIKEGFTGEISEIKEDIVEYFWELFYLLQEVIEKYHKEFSNYINQLLQNVEVSEDKVEAINLKVLEAIKTFRKNFQVMEAFKDIGKFNKFNFRESSPEVNPNAAVGNYLDQVLSTVSMVESILYPSPSKTSSKPEFDGRDGFRSKDGNGLADWGLPTHTSRSTQFDGEDELTNGDRPSHRDQYTQMIQTIESMAQSIDEKFRAAEEYLEIEGVEFPHETVKSILENMEKLHSSYEINLTSIINNTFSPDWVDSLLKELLMKDVSDWKLDDFFILLPEEMSGGQSTGKENVTRKLLKKEKGDTSPVDVWEDILRGDKRRVRELTEFLAKLFLLFLYDWFNWEIFGWLLALKLGFSPRQIKKYPELGWFAKAVTSYLLVRSDDRNARLIGRALLYHTEIPPEQIHVKVGGDIIPAVVAHYRRSAKHSPIIEELEKVFETLLED